MRLAVCCIVKGDVVAAEQILFVSGMFFGSAAPNRHGMPPRRFLLALSCAAVAGAADHATNGIP
jgi:hypothetical protein